MIGNNGIPSRANMACTGSDTRTDVRPHRLCEAHLHGRLALSLASATLLSPAQPTTIRNDVLTRLPQFFETATRVLDIDQKRQKSLALIAALSPAERKNAELRMRRECIDRFALVRAKLAAARVGLSFRA